MDLVENINGFAHGLQELAANRLELGIKFFKRFVNKQLVLP